MFGELHRTDREVDTVHAQILTEVTGSGWPHGPARACQLAVLARFYERFGDQAVSVAQRLEFAATGSMPV